MRSLSLRVIVLLVGTWLAVAGLWAADGTKGAKSDDGSAHRLPPYYNKIVDDVQRVKIYKIQDHYADDIKKLQEQLDALRAKRDKEVRDVLTPAQQRELDKLLETSKKEDKGSGKGSEKK